MKFDTRVMFPLFFFWFFDPRVNEVWSTRQRLLWLGLIYASNGGLIYASTGRWPTQAGLIHASTREICPLQVIHASTRVELRMKWFDPHVNEVWSTPSTAAGRADVAWTRALQQHEVDNHYDPIETPSLFHRSDPPTFHTIRGMSFPVLRAQRHVSSPKVWSTRQRRLIYTSLRSTRQRRFIHTSLVQRGLIYASMRVDPRVNDDFFMFLSNFLTKKDPLVNGVWSTRQRRLSNALTTIGPQPSLIHTSTGVDHRGNEGWFTL